MGAPTVKFDRDLASPDISGDYEEGEPTLDELLLLVGKDYIRIVELLICRDQLRDVLLGIDGYDPSICSLISSK